MDFELTYFLQKAENEKQRRQEEEKKELLVSLGLIKNKERHYSPDKKQKEPYTTWDWEKKNFYYEECTPITVTDEEYELVKQYAYLFEKKEESRAEVIEEAKTKLEYDNKAEKILEKFNKVLLIVLLVVAGLTLIGGIVAIVDYEEPLPYFFGAIGIALAAVITWASIKVLLNISNNLHEVNAKLK